MAPRMAATPTPGGAAEGATLEAIGVIDPLRVLTSISQSLKSLSGTDWPTVIADNSKDVVRTLEQIMRTTAAVQAEVLAATETSGKWALDGQRNFNSWLSSQTGTTRGTAGRAVRLSKSLQEDLPETREALAQGTISSDHAQIIARRCTKTDRHRKKLADPDRGEAFLLEQAKQMDATKFAKVASSWAIATDPEAADRQWRKESAKEEICVAPSEDGYYLTGFLNHASGTLVDEALRALMGRKPAGDPRSYNERRADAMVALASRALDSGNLQPNARIRPHLTVTVEYDTLRRLVDASGPIMPSAAGEGVGAGKRGDEAEWAKAWSAGEDHVISTSLDYTKLIGATPAVLPDGTPLPHKVLARFACESMLTRVVFGPQSTVLNVGREQRIFTVNQARAIIARDRTCRYPGCDEPPGFGEIHHSVSWAKHQGNTDVDLGILLCFHHHDLVHERDISIIRHGGTWVFTSRHGHEIGAPEHGMTTRASAQPRQSPSTSPGRSEPRNLTPRWPSARSRRRNSDGDRRSPDPRTPRGSVEGRTRLW